MSTMRQLWPHTTRYTTHIYHAHGVVLLYHLLGILYDGFQVGQPISDLWGGGINESETCTALWQRGRAKVSLLPGHDIVAPRTQHTSLLEAPQLHTPSNMGSSALHTPHVTWDPNSGAWPCRRGDRPNMVVNRQEQAFYQPVTTVSQLQWVRLAQHVWHHSMHTPIIQSIIKQCSTAKHPPLRHASIALIVPTVSQFMLQDQSTQTLSILDTG